MEDGYKHSMCGKRGGWDSRPWEFVAVLSRYRPNSSQGCDDAAWLQRSRNSLARFVVVASCKASLEATRRDTTYLRHSLRLYKYSVYSVYVLAIGGCSCV